MSAIVEIRGAENGSGLGYLVPLSESTETPSKSLSGKPFWLLFHAFSFRLVMTSSQLQSLWGFGSGFVIGDTFEAILLLAV